MKKFEERKKRMRRIISKLEQLFPKAQIALNFKNNWELLVAVILSAQCTDKKVNEVTAKLFKKYKTLADYADANPKEFEQDIFQTGFYRNKAKHIIGAAKRIRDVFGGEVPQTMPELLTLPGVARKTANVVLSNAFDVHDGIAVDTHVRRFVIRFDLSDFKDPARIERDLMKLVPQAKWNTVTYGFIEYGRTVCPARKHDCTAHPLTKIFPKAAFIWPKAK